MSETVHLSTELTADITMRPFSLDDAGALAEAYRRNREHLAPWEPVRPDEFFTARRQEALIAGKLQRLVDGSEVPWGLFDGGTVVGAVTLTGIIRGPFLSGDLGYWIDKDHTGQGLCTAAVAFVGGAARAMGLHRIQASTLLHNAASRKVLARLGFTEIGVAPEYLQIAGKWQDHMLHQLILGDRKGNLPADRSRNQSQDQPGGSD
ncbi:GNAT family protein [Pseudarthrobacter sp. J75]|uniref:GNAT family N-acetyltransferase n=1 Tax=unclassified Pseudarthrobacter TaxID=2647000 RepID=UPI002E8228C9|nr:MULTISPECIES: GNAT family protein [unclassified Pseudarthrobacter]MEE2524193.1 GNAT family protein [Pseudarthrobacter sp. J47]MEE2530231.1 GNAT family protein [Pseudarthrobacter sp. J75]MEE2568899.1 GNAT family protein [Pseudarthrobacter sp. J64]